MQLVAAGTTVERIVSRATEQCVIAGAAVQGIVAGAAVDHIVAGQAREHVCAILAEDDVGLIGTVDGITLQRTIGGQSAPLLDRQLQHLGQGVEEFADLVLVELQVRGIQRQRAGEEQEGIQRPGDPAGTILQRFGAQPCHPCRVHIRIQTQTPEP